MRSPPSGRLRAEEQGRIRPARPVRLILHPSAPQPSDEEEPFDSEGHAPARPDRGDAREPPTDGRQLLGWAAKPIPDLKGVLIGYGKKKGLHSKIVEWTPQQVAAAYRFARARQAQPRR